MPSSSTSAAVNCTAASSTVYVYALNSTTTITYLKLSATPTARNTLTSFATSGVPTSGTTGVLSVQGASILDGAFDVSRSTVSFTSSNSTAAQNVSVLLLTTSSS